MNKNNTIAFATCASLALTFAGAAFASEQNGAAKSNPAAIRAYNSVAPVAGNHYDSGCLIRGLKDSNEYTKCMQNLPAHAMVGGGGY